MSNTKSAGIKEMKINIKRRKSAEDQFSNSSDDDILRDCRKSIHVFGIILM